MIARQLEEYKDVQKSQVFKFSKRATKQRYKEWRKMSN